MKVGLFDSGIGGLSVLKRLMEKYPKNEYIYFGDTKNLPYGSKSVEELKILAKNNIDFLLKFNVDIIIIACGTVSSNCLDYLKDSFNIPIIDIISPTINYLNNSNYNNIGIIATEATINSHIFKKNINRNIYEIATPKLVPLIEGTTTGDLDTILKKYLNDYIDKIDVLVLGCTHYPLISSNIKKIIGDTKLLNMADYINIDNDGNGKVNIYFSKIDNKLINNVKKITGINNIYPSNN